MATGFASLVGVSKYQPAIATARVGDPVYLVCQPGNVHDPRAVVAIHRGRAIGYVGRDTELSEAVIRAQTAVQACISSLPQATPAITAVVVNFCLPS